MASANVIIPRLLPLEPARSTCRCRSPKSLQPEASGPSVLIIVGMVYGLTMELSHSRWQRARVCNHSIVTLATVELDRAAAVGSSDLVRPSQRETHLKLLPFRLVQCLTAKPILEIIRQPTIDAAAMVTVLSRGKSESIISAIAMPKGAANANARYRTKTACPITHHKASDSLRCRSESYSGCLNGTMRQRINGLTTELRHAGPQSVTRESGTVAAIPRCLQRFVRCLHFCPQYFSVYHAGRSESGPKNCQSSNVSMKD